MAYTYIISDIRFNDFDAAKANFTLIEDYNDFRINKWNSVVNEDDQLSGVGFAVTTSADNDKRSVILKVTGKATTRIIKVTF